MGHVQQELALTRVLLYPSECVLCSSTSSTMAHEDILFTFATVIEGDDDSVPYEADVLVKDGLIAAIGPGLSAPGARVIDAKGHVLSPGFIDMHAHSDLYLLTHPDHEPKISQGCTVSTRRDSELNG